MKFAALVLALLGFVGAMLVPKTPDAPEALLVIGGDTRGYLAPCGCSDPMLGGIERRATIIRALAKTAPTVVIENGGLVNGVGRQDEMKAETLAQALGELGSAAINLGPTEAALGRGEVSQLTRLAGGAFTSASIADPDSLGMSSFVERGPFRIAGVVANPPALAGALGQTPRPLEDSVNRFVDGSEANLVLMVQGDRDVAMRIAKAHPKLAVVVYSAGGQPAWSRVGDTWLVTPGERGKNVVVLELTREGLIRPRAIPLGPAVADDPVVGRFLASYLRRVDREDLLEKLPRTATASYAGSWACQDCHRDAMRTWKHSAHRQALVTLESKGHDHDPDCVSCHVVGLASTKGFRSRATTPQFAGVGCESCHGPLLAHVKNPVAVRPPKIGPQACVSCHNPDNSPHFDYSTYWSKIAH